MTTNNLLEVIDQMIEAECGISPCSFEISHILRKVRKHVVADQQSKEEKIRKWVDFWSGEWTCAHDQLLAIVTGKEQGDKQE